LGDESRVANRDTHLAGLMRSAVGGDENAYRQVLQELAPILRGMVKSGFARYGIGAQEVEDVVQETLLALHLKRHTWDVRLPLLPWVRAIAHYKLIDNLRRRGRAIYIPIEEMEEILTNDAQPHESRLDAARALAHLKGRQQDIVRAISIEGATGKQVAARFGMTENAVRVTLHRALQNLARVFRDKNHYDA
jgi:RNA polymerase sigma-70 factor, ECF subfamily